MGIIYCEKDRTFTLQTKETTYQMQVDQYGFLLHLYYGKKAEGCMDYLLTYYDRGFSGNPYDAGTDRTYSMDSLPQELSCYGNGDFRSASLMLENGDGSMSCDMRYKNYTIRDGKYSLPGLPAVYADNDEAQTLEIVLEDPATGVEAMLLYGVLPELDIITRSVYIRNQSSEKIYVNKVMSAELDFLYGDYDLLTFYGRHAMERNLQRVPVAHGSQMIGSVRGTSSHQYNPMMILAEKDTTEDHGGCYAMSFVYSGNFQGEVLKDQYNQTRMLLGVQEECFRYPLEAGETFYAPEVILSYTDQGMNRLSQNLHSCIRHHICRGKYKTEVRPVLVNSWEAAYFDFTGETLYNLAKEARSLGIDMLVLDDGWFGKRDDDNSGLGDWYVNEKKLGETLGGLVKRVNDLGVKFGIWIEPEMVNPKSELFEKHPDWAIHLPNRETYYYRNQLVLDLSNPKVQDYVFSVVDNIMIENPDLAFFKWDCNSPITNVYSPYLKEKQNQLYIDHVRGVYNVFKRVAEKYPHLPIMLCSGGGARCDYEALKYFTEFWCSDNTDPIERLYIQWGFSQFFPAKAMCAHVTSWNKNTSVKFRTDVAMMCKMGFDISLKEMNDDEMKYCQEAVANYKRLKGTILDGDLYRLVSPYETNHSSVMYVDKAKSKSVLFAYDIHPRFGEKTFPVKLQGLDPNKKYKVQEINLMPGKKSALATDGGTFSGDFLMKIGLNVFSTAHARSKVIELTEVH